MDRDRHRELARQYTLAATTTAVRAADASRRRSNSGAAASPSGSFTVTPDSTAPTASVTYTGGIVNAPAVTRDDGGVGRRLRPRPP